MIEKVYVPVLEYRKLDLKHEGFVELRMADCDYCLRKRSESKYHPNTCSHCGAELRGLSKFIMNPLDGTWREIIII